MSSDDQVTKYGVDFNDCHVTGLALRRLHTRLLGSFTLPHTVTLKETTKSRKMSPLTC